MLNDTLEENPTGRRRDYIPSSDPGSRLPHTQIRIIGQNKFHLTTVNICSMFYNMVNFFLVIFLLSWVALKGIQCSLVLTRKFSRLHSLA